MRGVHILAINRSNGLASEKWRVFPTCKVNSMPKHFTKEFEAEAVRLARTSGRTHREIADDLGIGLSTLKQWISKHCDRDDPDKAASQDMATELSINPADPAVR